MHGGEDKWPKTVLESYRLMVQTEKQLKAIANHREMNNERQGRGSGRTGGAQLIQQEEQGGRGRGYGQGGGSGTSGRYVRPAVPEGTVLVPGVDGTTSDVQCYNCQQWGHIAPNCPCPHQFLMISSHFLMSRLQLSQTDDNGLPHSWLLLDTCSSNSTTNDAIHVTNITQCYVGDKMTTLTNGGQAVFDKVADLKLLPMKVYFDQNSMANVLSYHEVKSLPGIRITMDTEVEDTINVILKEKNEYLKFKLCGAGLYYLDVAKMSEHRFAYLTANEDVIAYSDYTLVQTVARNCEFLTTEELDNVDRALCYQDEFGW